MLGARHILLLLLSGPARTTAGTLMPRCANTSSQAISSAGASTRTTDPQFAGASGTAKLPVVITEYRSAAPSADPACSPSRSTDVNGECGRSTKTTNTPPVYFSYAPENVSTRSPTSTTLAKSASDQRTPLGTTTSSAQSSSSASAIMSAQYSYASHEPTSDNVPITSTSSTISAPIATTVVLSTTFVTRYTTVYRSMSDTITESKLMSSSLPQRSPTSDLKSTTSTIVATTTSPAQSPSRSSTVESLPTETGLSATTTTESSRAVTISTIATTSSGIDAYTYAPGGTISPSFSSASKTSTASTTSETAFPSSRTSSSSSRPYSSPKGGITIIPIDPNVSIVTVTITDAGLHQTATETGARITVTVTSG